MKTLSKCVVGAVAGLGIASVVHAAPYGPGNPATMTLLPADFKLCAEGGKVCKVANSASTTYVLYGKGNKFATAQGNGDFTCLPKGWVKTPTAATPQDLGVDDPIPNGAKDCYVQVTGSAPATQAQAQPVAAVPPGAQKCADDFGTCTPPANWASSTNGKLYYGASGKFVEIPVGPATKPFVCHPNTFGIPDPLPNVKKTCYLLAGAAPQPKPIVMPNLAAPSNLQIAVEAPKAPVPVVIPVLLNEAQKAEYLRWTDALREEFLKGYQPLTTDAQRLDFIRSKLTTPAPTNEVASTLATETVVVLKVKSSGKYMGPYERSGVNYWRAMYTDTADPKVHLKISRPDANVSLVALTGVQLSLTERPVLGVTVSNNFLYLMTKARFDMLKGMFPTDYTGVDFKSLSLFTIEGTSLDSVRLKSNKTGTYVSIDQQTQSAVTGGQPVEFVIEKIVK